MNVKRYVKRMQKKVLKISKNLFGLDTFPSLASYMIEVKDYVERMVGKDVDEFTEDDIKSVPLDYAIYKTCRKLCDVYMSFTEFVMFDINGLTEDDDGSKGV